MIKLPKKIKVGCAVYNIVFPYKFENNCLGYAGLHWSTRSSILVSNEFNGSKRSNVKIVETFIHEILHAIDFVYLDSIFEEDEIDTLGITMTDLLISNKNFNLEKDKIPKKLKIGPYNYNIIFPYKHMDTPEFLFQSDEENSKYFLRSEIDGDNLPYHVIKSNLLLMIICSLLSSYRIEKEKKSIETLITFSRGVLQTFVDNKIFSLIDKQRSLLSE